ncbi:chromatin assembly factor 1 subunit B-like [Mercenaria mercenaria]|uniref:chromatin assembly factor 1 subunit B-like n=1 Tax=Mercenaria mercenaria TaxID=6596 RepID=UPI00234E6245|nr:chromatin assembly factor 1 subunit B-like [Mercenaria mercenaria]
MKVTTPEISWHERDPIYSVDVQPGNRPVRRLVSGGVDKFVRIWQIKEDLDGKACVEFLANLKRHTKAVNVCRFSPDGDVLATAGDDSVIIFWKLSETCSVNNIFQEDEEDNKENWGMLKVLRGHLEDIYDICWSADGKYMISGSVDNSAILWDLTKDQKMGIFNEHKSFVQGVAWDPKNEFVATLSTDRSCRIYNVSSRSCIHNVQKMVLPPKPQTTDSEENKDTKPKSFRMFHDDTMRSFFRRLTFTPDGELLIVPAGCVEADPVTNATFVFARNCLSKPALYLPSPDKVTIAARCCPTKFQLRKVPRKLEQDKQSDNLKEWEKYSTLFCLPYRLVFAVATEDSIQLYDTQQAQPFGFITNIHYHQLSDLAWSTDGRTLVASSTDGYCTLATFGKGELGVPYEESKNVEEDVAMETETGGDDLHLVLESSTDDSRETTDSSKTTSPVAKPKAMEIKVKSSDGKPKNIQITTISSLPGKTDSNSNLGSPKVPSIQVKSADGKPRNVQITTLATYTSPKSKGVNSGEPKKTETSEKKIETPDKKTKVLKEKTENITDCIVIDDDSQEKCDEIATTPKTGSVAKNKTGDDKSTPKRVQLTTLQLFNSNSQSPKTNKGEKS